MTVVHEAVGLAGEGTRCGATVNPRTWTQSTPLRAGVTCPECLKLMFTTAVPTDGNTLAAAAQKVVDATAAAAAECRNHDLWQAARFFEDQRLNALAMAEAFNLIRGGGRK